MREVSEKLYEHARLGGAKVVWLQDAALLTEAAANALLKTLEEPPANCWFFLSVREPARLLATLRSRCMTWHLSPPEETHSLQWLQKQQPQPEAILRAALRLSNGAPAAALALLQPDRWQARQTLCDSLNSALSGDILQLLPALNSDDVAVRLGWLLSLLLDAMKVQQGASNWLSNGDRPDVVTQLAQQFSSSALNASVQQWLQCREQLLHVAALNRELILTDCLLCTGNVSCNQALRFRYPTFKRDIMFLVDSHCHLDGLDYESLHKDVDDVLAKAAARDVKFCLAVATTLPGYRRMRELVGDRDNVVFSCGVHPLNQDEEYDVEELRRLAAEEGVVAMGETGLDYFYTPETKARQQASFRNHIRIGPRPE